MERESILSLPCAQGRHKWVQEAREGLWEKRQGIGSIPPRSKKQCVLATGSCLMAGKTGKEQYARSLGGSIRDRRRKKKGIVSIKVTKELTAVKTWWWIQSGEAIGDCHIPLTG